MNITGGKYNSRKVKTAEFEITYGKGICQEACILDMAVQYNIIQKTGSWFAYNDEKIGQGKENAKQYLISHPEVMEEVEKLVNMIEADFGEIKQEDVDFGEIKQEDMDDKEWLLKLNNNLDELQEKIFINRFKLLKDFENFVNKVKEIKI